MADAISLNEKVTVALKHSLNQYFVQIAFKGTLEIDVCNEY